MQRTTLADNIFRYIFFRSGRRVNVLKFWTLFSFQNKMLVIRAGIYKMLVRIANRETSDQTLKKQSDLGLRCLARPFWQITSVWMFRTTTIMIITAYNFFSKFYNLFKRVFHLNFGQNCVFLTWNFELNVQIHILYLCISSWNTDQISFF